MQDEAFEFITPDNYSVKSNKIRYTTMRKAKGLERDVIILVTSPPVDKKMRFQRSIGASRAKAKGYLLAAMDQG